MTKAVKKTTAPRKMTLEEKLKIIEGMIENDELSLWDAMPSVGNFIGDSIGSYGNISLEYERLPVDMYGLLNANINGPCVDIELNFVVELDDEQTYKRALNFYKKRIKDIEMCYKEYKEKKAQEKKK